MRRILTALITTLGLVWLVAAPAHATANWSSVRSAVDKDEHVTLQIWWRVDLNDPEEGFKLEGVTITAAKHDATLYDHVDGKGVSAWNDNNVIKWQKDGSETNLWPTDTSAASKHWDLELVMSTSHTLTVGFFFHEVYSSGGAGINGCTKIKIERGNPNAVSGYCSA